MEANMVTLDYDIKNLTPGMVEAAEKQLGEIKEVKLQALEELRLLIKNERSLVIPNDDEYLLQFLRCRKFDTKKAFKVLQNYWNFIEKHRRLFENIEIPRMKELFLRNCFGVLPQRDLTGCTVVIFKLGLWDLKKDPFEILFQAYAVLLGISLLYPATQVYGYRFIFDYRGFNLSLLKLCTPSILKLLVHSSLNCIPARYKAFHGISDNKFINIVLSLICPMLPAKIIDRIILHGTDFEGLKQLIHPSVLPREYGGEADSFDNNYLWNKCMEEDSKQWLKLLSYGYRS